MALEGSAKDKSTLADWEAYMSYGLQIWHCYFQGYRKQGLYTNFWYFWSIWLYTRQGLHLRSGSVFNVVIFCWVDIYWGWCWLWPRSCSYLLGSLEWTYVVSWGRIFVAHYVYCCLLIKKKSFPIWSISDNFLHI